MWFVFIIGIDDWYVWYIWLVYMIIGTCGAVYICLLVLMMVWVEDACIYDDLYRLWLPIMFVIGDASYW